MDSSTNGYALVYGYRCSHGNQTYCSDMGGSLAWEECGRWCLGNEKHGILILNL